MGSKRFRNASALRCATANVKVLGSHLALLSTFAGSTDSSSIAGEAVVNGRSGKWVLKTD